MSCKFFSISTYDYIRNTCLHYIDELELVLCPLCYDCYMMNRIRHNSPSPIQCLRAFHILFFAYLLFRATVTITTKPKNITLLPLPLFPYYFATKYFAADTKLSRCG